ncbi:hypothetical protein C7271_01720 [filamentous cyanobacterium CCP5]|nr:hypothetical protein C7271_01720 [filamentous cyanobacterium CCP5]
MTSGSAFNPGLKINFELSPYAVLTDSTDLEQISKGLNQAASVWSSYLSDNVVVNIQVNLVPDFETDFVLGAALSATTHVNYDKWLEAFFKDVTSQADWDALTTGHQLVQEDHDQLLSYAAGTVDEVKFKTKEFDVRLDAISQEAIKSGNGDPTLIDSDGNENNKKIWLTRANAKALGLEKPDDDKLDGIISINTSAPWDFDPSNGIGAGQYDFQAMALQEMAHIFGFSSGQDAFETIITTTDKNLKDKDLTYVAPIDLYRYSPESRAQGVFDITSGGKAGTKFFSIDGGKTSLANFSTGSLSSGGDGYQASHWQSSWPPIGVMNPDLRPGERVSLSKLDVLALNVIGWDPTGESFSIRSSDSATFEAFKLDLESSLGEHRSQYLAKVEVDLNATHPDYDFSKLLERTAGQIEIEFHKDAQKVLDDLNNKLQKETDLQKQKEEFQKVEEKIWKLQSKLYDEGFDKLAEDIFKAFEKLDESVEKLIQEKDPKKLAEKLSKASTVELRKFIRRIEDFPSGSARRIELEGRILQATVVVDGKPSKELQELLKSAGPTGNPIGWSRFWSAWFWFWQKASPLNQEGQVQVDDLSGLPL